MNVIDIDTVRNCIWPRWQKTTEEEIVFLANKEFGLVPQKGIWAVVHVVSKVSSFFTGNNDGKEQMKNGKHCFKV